MKIETWPTVPRGCMLILLTPVNLRMCYCAHGLMNTHKISSYELNWDIFVVRQATGMPACCRKSETSPFPCIFNHSIVISDTLESFGMQSSD